MKRLIYILIILGLANSCNYQSTKTIDIDSKERIKIFQNKYLSTPDTSLQIGENELLFVKRESSKEYVRDGKYMLIILEKIGDNWGEVKDTVISKGVIELGEYKVVSIDNKKYLYYEEYWPGGSWGNSDLEFTLFDFDSGIKYYIHYSEEPEAGTTSIDFKRSKTLASKQNLQSYLEDNIKNSNRIHKPDNEEILVGRFKVENEKALHEIYDSYSFGKPIKFKQINTKEKLFDVVSLKRSSIASILKSIQNDNFIIISIFRGPVLGYNKSTKEYSCLWVPDFYDSIREMRFDLNGNLVLYDNQDRKPNYLINLYNSIYIRLK